MIDGIRNYYLEMPEPQKGCLLALRSIILEQDGDITETVKYTMPCFCCKGKMFCFLWTDKHKENEPYILFVEGKRLDHPDLETGNQARMKILRGDPSEDLPIETITLLLNQALDLYRHGVIKI